MKFYVMLFICLFQSVALLAPKPKNNTRVTDLLLEGLVHVPNIKHKLESIKYTNRIYVENNATNCLGHYQGVVYHIQREYGIWVICSQITVDHQDEVINPATALTSLEKNVLKGTVLTALATSIRGKKASGGWYLLDKYTKVSMVSNLVFRSYFPTIETLLDAMNGNFYSTKEATSKTTLPQLIYQIFKMNKVKSDQSGLLCWETRFDVPKEHYSFPVKNLLFAQKRTIQGMILLELFENRRKKAKEDFLNDSVTIAKDYSKRGSKLWGADVIDQHLKVITSEHGDLARILIKVYFASTDQMQTEIAAQKM